MGGWVSFAAFVKSKEEEDWKCLCEIIIMPRLYTEAEERRNVRMMNPQHLGWTDERRKEQMAHAEACRKSRTATIPPFALMEQSPFQCHG